MVRATTRPRCNTIRSSLAIESAEDRPLTESAPLTVDARGGCGRRRRSLIGCCEAVEAATVAVMEEGVGVDLSVPVERIALDPTSWVDVSRNWLRNADDLFVHRCATPSRGAPRSSSRHRHAVA